MAGLLEPGRPSEPHMLPQATYKCALQDIRPASDVEHDLTDRESAIAANRAVG